tara:strand:- start:14521 stop:15573 length:1053 start_codon:yes stop_codon:yes gene_type:complete
MAVNVNEVYRTVLIILNKEQRGYMTPEEFNKIGSQVQKEIFERYFEDLNQLIRVPQTDLDYSDRVESLDEKMSIFKTETEAVYSDADNNFTLPPLTHIIGSVTHERKSNNSKYDLPTQLQKVGRTDFFNLRRSPMLTPSETYPIYLLEENKISVYPNSLTSGAELTPPDNKIMVQYIKKPKDPIWGYALGNAGQFIYDSSVYSNNNLQVGTSLTVSATGPFIQDATIGTYNNVTFTSSNTSSSGLIINATITSTTAGTFQIAGAPTGFNIGDTITIDAGQLGASSTGPKLVVTNINMAPPTGSVNFELHNSEFVELVLNILLYAGIIIRDPQVVQAAAGQLQADRQNQKQ